MLRSLLQSNTVWVVDIEANGLHPYNGNHIIGVSFYFPNTGDNIYYPIRHGVGDHKKRRDIDYGNLPVDDLRAMWNDCMTPDKVVLGHNTKFDLHFLVREGFAEPTTFLDTMITAYLVLEDWNFTLGGSLELKWLSNYFKIEDALLGEQELEDIAKGLGIKAKSEMWLMTSSEVERYAKNDTRLTWELYLKLMPILETWDSLELHDMKQRINMLTFEMEKRGIYLDMDKLQVIKEPLVAEKASIVLPFNPNSPKQVVEYFASIGINLPDSSSETLDSLGDDERTKDIQRYRKLGKMLNTYIANWEKSYSGGRIRSSFKVTGTDTGRLSSSGLAGNFQNIPERGRWTIKESCVAPDGYSILCADYGALELYLATHVAENELGLGNSEMTTLLRSGVDPHAHTRDVLNVRLLVFGNMSDEAILVKIGYKPSDDPKLIDKFCRQLAKTCNFGLLYGMWYKKLAIMTNTEIPVAQRLHSAWHEAYPAFTKANEYYRQLANKRRPKPNGEGLHLYVTQPIFGQHRRYTGYATDYKAKDGRVFNMREMKTKDAFNFVVQGMGGNITLYSALKLPKWIEIFSIIHDAIDCYVPTSRLDEAKQVMTDVMTNWDLAVKLKVAFASGSNWQHVK